MKNNQILSYNPSISYEKDYYSDRQIIEEVNITNIDNTEIKDNVDKLEDIISNIEIGTAGLNNDLKDLIAGVLDPVVDFIQDNKDFFEDIESVEKDDDSENVEDDDTIIDDEVIFIPIVNILDNESNDKKSSIKKIYKDNLVELFNDFLIKLKTILNNYWVNMGAILIGQTKDYKKFILNNMSQEFVVEKEKQHMLDLAMRSQIHRISKTSYASKIFPVDETLIHLRSLKMTTDLMLRYLEIDIDDMTTEYGDSSKSILTSCIINYNNKYNYTYKSTYKYLNSSVELIDEVLQLSIQEAKTKKYLK